MKLPVPYFKQETDYDCGPAVVQMLCSFYGKSFSPEHIHRALKTSPEHGTHNHNMANGLESLGFSVHTQSNSSVEDIRKFLEQGTPVAVNFIEPDTEDGHHSLIVGIDDYKLIFNDPALGQDFSLEISEFENRWRGGFGDSGQARWLMTARLKG